MKGRYGTQVQVRDDVDQEFELMDADVVLTVDGEDALLSPQQARKLAKKLKKRANKVEIANAVATARRGQTDA